MRPFALSRFLVATLVPAACTAGIETEPGERVREGRARIVGDEAHVDDTHAAVVAILGEAGRMCSGTAVGRSADGDTLYVLTAAHCCRKSAPPREIAVGADSSEPARTLAVEGFQQHPCYNALSHDYDFCVLRIKDQGSLNARPIPLAATPDRLGPGSTVTFVGYGSTPASNIARRRVEARLAGVTPLTIAADQTNGQGGVCFGDSGGPALIVQGGIEVVAGVASFGAPTSLCDVIGVAGRVENPGVRREFIDKVLAGQEPVIKDLLILRTGISPGQVRDTYLASDEPTRNLGDSVVLHAGTPPGTPAIHVPLLRFDLSGVPAGATIFTAHAGLHQASKTGAGTIAVHRVTRDWDEDRETWASFGRGGYDPIPLTTVSNATAIVNSTEQLWFDLTRLTQDWLAGRADNYGIMLREPEREQTRFMSSEIGRITERPWLHLCYLPKGR
jgi:secreted trypsin-like serine protease